MTSAYTGTGSTYGVRGAAMTVKNGGVFTTDGLSYGTAFRLTIPLDKSTGSFAASTGATVTMRGAQKDDAMLSNTITGGSVQMQGAGQVVGGIRRAAESKVTSTPVNAAGQALTRFDLDMNGAAYPTDGIISMGSPAYAYQVGTGHNGTAFVWAPAVKVAFWTDETMSTGVPVSDTADADGARNVLTLISGNGLALVGAAAPEAPAQDGKICSGWINAATQEPVDPATAVFTADTDLYPVYRDVTVLPVDILVRQSTGTEFDTENAAVFKCAQGDTLDFRAVLDTTVVQQQMAGVEQKMGVPEAGFSTIALTYPVDPDQNIFTAVITIPAGFTFDADAIRLADNSLYRLDGLKLLSGTVGGAAVTNQPVTSATVVTSPAAIEVRMALKTDELPTYDKLHAAIFGTSALTLDMPGVTVTGAGKLTVAGSLTGRMNAKATMTAILTTMVAPAVRFALPQHTFGFEYIGRQNHNLDGSNADGADFLVRDGSARDDIRLTVNAIKTAGASDGQISKSKKAAPVELSGAAPRTTVTLSLPGVGDQADSDIVLGSGTVTDRIGDQFDLAVRSGVCPFVLTEGGQTLTAETITDGSKWGFGKNTAGQYSYTVEYIPGAEEQFVWRINVPVERTRPVQLSYELSLNDTTKTASYPTNRSALLECVDASGENDYRELFEVPQVHYTVQTGGGESTSYTLTFETNGGSAVAAVTRTAGTTVSLTQTSSRSGYTFEGWYSEAALTNKVTSVTLDRSKTVYAKWTPSERPELFRDDHVAYVIGYPDGKVRPEANITRAEVATIFFRLLNEETRTANMTTVNNFSDVRANDWYNRAVSTLAAMGIVKGYEDGCFRGGQPITRAEFAAIAARFESSVYTGSDQFSDISGIWAQELINRAAKKGWILGYADGTFRPEKAITRAEAMTLINRVLVRQPESEADLLSGMIVWPDNGSAAWYYLAVQEATNSHAAAMKSDAVHESWTKLTATPDWKSYEK